MERVTRVLQDGDPVKLQRFREVYESQLTRGPPSAKAEYDYAHSLVKSPNKLDIQRGIYFLEDLFQKTSDDLMKSEYLYYVSIGYTRLKDYEKAMKYCTAILRVEPRNIYALELRDHIEQTMRKDGLIGIALVGGALVLVISGIVGLVMVFRRRK